MTVFLHCLVELSTPWIKKYWEGAIILWILKFNWFRDRKVVGIAYNKNVTGINVSH